MSRLIPLLLLGVCLSVLPACKKRKTEAVALDVAQQMEAFDKRKIYKRLTPEILARIPDDLLEQAVVDYVDEKLGDGKDEAPIIKGMSEGIRALHATWILDGEVNNGGFNQFFWNTGHKYDADAVAGFKLFGLPKLEQLMKRAIAINQKDAQRLEKLKERGSLEAFSESYKNNPLSALDDQYYAANESLSAARIKFIRKHPELFRGD